MNKPIDLSGVTLKTPRLILRPWRLSDLEDLYAYAKVEGVGQMAGWLPHRDIGESRQVLERFIDEKKTFALEHEGRAIGSLGVERYNEKEHPELDALSGRELGFVLAKDYWGRGLMPEAVREVCRYLFEQEGLDFLIAGCFEWNHQSARTLEKCGFAFIGGVPSVTTYLKVEWCLDHILYNPALEPARRIGIPHE